MNLQPEVLSNLRTLLVPVDKAQNMLLGLASQIGQAEAAAFRLTSKIAELDRQAADISACRIKSDAERVALLIAGAEVPQADKKEIEAHAQKARVLAAQRQQMVEDLEAVRQHVADINRAVSKVEAAHKHAELVLLSAIGEAEIEAYQSAAMDFVRNHIPPLSSLAHLIAQKSGELPTWWHPVLAHLRVSWWVPDPNPQHQKLGLPIASKEINVWPRLHPDFANKLITGELSNSPDIVEGLISAIREHQSEQPSQIENAMTLIDANLSAEEAELGQQVH